MDDERRKKVFLQAAGCMENLVSSSGHLSSYSLLWETFEITSVTELGAGLTEYGFAAMATVQSEFMDDLGGADGGVVGEMDPISEDGFPAAGKLSGPEPDLAMMEPVPDDGGVAGGGTTPVTASIVLDTEFGLALDPQGNARLAGYSCLPPVHWHPDFMAQKS